MNRRKSETSMRIVVVTVAALLGTAAAPGGDGFVTEIWGDGPPCHHPGTLRLEGSIAALDLSALPEATEVHRAVLRARFRRGSYETAIAIHALADGEVEAPATTPALALRPPRYDSFDATDAVRRSLAGGSRLLRLRFKAAPGWEPRATTLEVTFRGPSGVPTPAVSGLRAVHHDGQTFLVWREHEDILGDRPSVTIEAMEEKLLPLRGGREVVYRVYASDRPISAETLGLAEPIAEVPFVLSLYDLDSVPTIEHPSAEKGEGSTPFVGGARAKRHQVPAFAIAKGAEPLPRGTGLYVRTIVRPGSSWYAVVTAVGGRECVPPGGLSAGNSLREPVTESPAPPIPVLQSSAHLESQERSHPGWTIGTYAYWLEFPYSNVPRQLAVATRQYRGLPPEERGELCVNLGFYGSQPAFIARERGGGHVTLCPPWDQDDSMLQGQHECVGTLRSYDQGSVHNWGQRRTLALIEWAEREFPVDPERVTAVGQFALWALRHGDVFSSVTADGYGNFNKGREAQKHGPLWGPYPRSSKNWLGVDHWDHINICKWIRENPTAELPYLVVRPTSSSHVGDMGPWAWPELYRALHDTKRAFTARHGGVWSGTPVAGTIMPARIRRDQSLPAFRNCSLDGMPGDGDMSNNGGLGADGDVVADLNGFILWETDSIVDLPDRWEMTVYLDPGDPVRERPGAPADSSTVDLTPRRCRRFEARPGERLQWTNTFLSEGREASGWTAADRWGLVTVEGLVVTKGRNRIGLRKAEER
jgi:hypothetical protein